MDQLERKDEINFQVLSTLIWNNKFFIFSVCLSSLVLSTLLCLYLPNTYKSEAVLIPSLSSSDRVDSLTSSLGGLATLAGINSIQGKNDKTGLALEVIKSRFFLTQFIEKHELSIALAAGAGWDDSKKEWILDSSIYNYDTKTWIEGGKFGESKKPSKEELYILIKERLNIVTEKKSGTIKIGFELYSPEKSKEWTELIIHDLSDFMRENDINEARRNIDFLKKQLIETPYPELQKIIYNLIAEQTKTIMLAKTKTKANYIFKVIDPPVVPEVKSGPRRVIIILTTLLVSLFLAIVIILSRYLYKKDPTITNEN